MTDVTASALADALRDRYALQRELGRGGMATVYLAYDLRHDRDVALKVLRPDLAAVLGRERFLAEIHVTAKLDHPHILTLIDSGESDGFLWYIVPFVRGESLRQKLEREKQLVVDEALAITKQVAGALDYAHRCGVIHRDVKPENILLHEGEAMLTDFGIALAVKEAAGSRLTETGLSLGTPHYMSPEQATGERQLDARSDVYSLGAVLYEMLAGEPPHTGATAQSVIAKLMTERPTRLRVMRDTVPEEVEHAVFAALSKVPADRPQTAARFAELLGAPGRATDSHRTANQSPAPSAMLARWRKPRAWSIPAAVLAIAALALWWVTGERAVRSAHPVVEGGPEKSRIAVLYFTDHSPKHDLAYLTDGLTEGLIRTLGGVRGLSVVSPGGVAQYRDGTVPRDSIARALKVGTLVAGSIEPERDTIRVTVRLLDDAGIELDRATFKKSAKDLVALADSLTEEVGLLIRGRIGKAVEWSRTRAGTRNTDAWARYQRALLARGKGDSLFQAGDTAGSTRAYLAADSLAAIAETLDPRWPDPSVLRGVLKYWRSRHTQNAGRVGRIIDSGLTHAERALALNPKHADAIELRGTLNYWRWLFFPMEPDSAQRDKLLAGAQADLEESTRLNPNQASAYATLSHLYSNVPGKTLVDVMYAANKALETDAYLGNADVITWRLTLAAYDAGQFAEADKWCQTGRRRFPENPRFLQCALLIMTADLRPPDPRRAWALADSMVLLTGDPSDRQYARLLGRVLVAGVLARAQQPDSARSLLDHTKPDPEIDPTADLAQTAAFVWTLVGDNAEALNQLGAYLTANPGRRADFRDNPNWWFQRLSEDPRYLELVGAPR